MEMDGQSLIGREFCGKTEMDRGEIEGVGQTADVKLAEMGTGIIWNRPKTHRKIVLCKRWNCGMKFISSELVLHCQVGSYH